MPSVSRSAHFRDVQPRAACNGDRLLRLANEEASYHRQQPSARRGHSYMELYTCFNMGASIISRPPCPPSMSSPNAPFCVA